MHRGSAVERCGPRFAALNLTSRGGGYEPVSLCRGYSGVDASIRRVFYDSLPKGRWLLGCGQIAKKLYRIWAIPFPKAAPSRAIIFQGQAVHVPEDENIIFYTFNFEGVPGAKYRA